MKKNVTINLFGQLYNIDEDAYELLNNYEEALRQYFRKQEEGAEIANDIESRIAELFAELKANGVEAITIEHVQDIIKRIGRPEEIDETSSQPSSEEEADGEPSGVPAPSAETSGSEAQGSRRTAKRFYRDGQNKMIAGVLAGLSNYFGGDVTLWRLGFVGLLLLAGGPSLYFENIPPFSSFSFSFIFSWGIIAYIVVAIITPEAKTPEERLRMKGREVTPETLADEVANEAQRRDIANGESGRQTEARGCIAGFFSALGVLIKVCLIAFGMLFIIPALVALCFAVAIAVAPSVTLPGIDSSLLYIYQNAPFIVWGLFACILLVCFIPAYCSVHAALTMVKKTQPMGIGQRIVWLLLWVASVAGIVGCGVKMQQVIDSYWDKQNEEELAENRYEGQVMRSHERDYFRKNKWHPVENSDNNNDFYIGGQIWPEWTRSGNYYTGDKYVRYLDANGADVRYQVERTDTVAKGRYTLSYVARAAGQGAVVFVKSPEWKDDIIMPITAYGGEGGPIWVDAQAQFLNAQIGNTAIPERVRQAARANDGKGAGWARYEIAVDMPKDGCVTYGVKVAPEQSTPDDPFVWFSATDFRLERTPAEKERR